MKYMTNMRRERERGGEGGGGGGKEGGVHRVFDPIYFKVIQHDRFEFNGHIEL